jgi:GT2 family glycosyltransferase
MFGKYPRSANGIEYDIVLVDNASPDQEEARAFYSQHETDYTIVRNKENIGFPRGCNIGAKRKASPLLLMLNSDVVLEPRAIEYMVQALNDPKIGVVGAKLLFPTAEQIAEAKMNPQIRPAGMIQQQNGTNIQGVLSYLLRWKPDHPSK